MKRRLPGILSGIFLALFLRENPCRFRNQTPLRRRSASRPLLPRTPPSRGSLYPWSRSNVKPTVTPAMGDVGGKFFGRHPDPARTRHYYIAAESVMWNYSSEKSEVICGPTQSQSFAPQHPSNKLRYFRYTDKTFQTKVKEDPGLGILGPVLRGTVGEFIEVTFSNRTTRPLSIHPHTACATSKDSEGAYYEPRPGLGAANTPPTPPSPTSGN